MLALRARARIPLLTILVSLLVPSLASTLPSSGAAAVTRGAARSPRGRVLVVTANLLEGFGAHDVTDMSEIDLFAARLMNQVPYAPDALLVQEVRRKSARYVARVMGAKTGFDYTVLVSAGKDPWKRRRGVIVKRDTAIIINADTMDPRRKKGYVVTRDPHDRARMAEKHNAYGAAREVGSRMDVLMVSVHIPRHRLPRRAKKFAKRLAKAYPSTSRRDAPVIGGDFNDVSPEWISGKLVGKRWWKRLTGDRYRYSDAMFETTKKRGKDYIFAKSRVAAGGIDWSYDPATARGNPARFYSDHRFRWALLR